MAIIDRGGKADPVFGRAVMSVTPQTLGTVFTAITGASITLPFAGSYRIYYHLRGVQSVLGNFITARLFNVTAGTAITDTEAIPLFMNATAMNLLTLQGIASMEVVLTVASPTIINLEAKASAATGTELRSDTAGRTLIGFNKL